MNNSISLAISQAKLIQTRRIKRMEIQMLAYATNGKGVLMYLNFSSHKYKQSQVNS